MGDYDLGRLGPREFEHLVQALLKEVIGKGIIPCGDGPDGGRDATFSGSAPYPSQIKQWEGNWIFQIKFHDVKRLGTDRSRSQIVKDLKSELTKIVQNYGSKYQNYILITNVSLSYNYKSGIKDKIDNDIIPQFQNQIPHIHIWSYDDICRFLDAYPDIRLSYLHLITPGDLIGKLMKQMLAEESQITESIMLYLDTSFKKEMFSKLKQAGEILERNLSLPKVYIDLRVSPRSEKDLDDFTAQKKSYLMDCVLQFREHESISATKLLISNDINRAIILGGPGQGKSTFCQFIAQIHRAYLLNKVDELIDDKKRFVPTKIRIPFKIVLKDLAQWVFEGSPNRSVLESYISRIIKDFSGRELNVLEIQDIMRKNPTLIILDGLDEVIEKNLRKEMLDLIDEFIGRSELIKADQQIIITSRTVSYSNQFNSSNFLHLALYPMDSENVLEYTESWIRESDFEDNEIKSLRENIRRSLSDPNVSQLMNTPLQVTIIILIILDGGRPPQQREELFNTYLETIYKREKKKLGGIIKIDAAEKELLFEIHQYLGYLLHRRSMGSKDTRSLISVDEFKDEIVLLMRHKDRFADIDILIEKADLIVKEARERLVLIVGANKDFSDKGLKNTNLDDEDLVGFELRSIQEFFAASYLVDTASGNEQRYERFKAIAINPHWRNVSLFFAGRVSRLFRGESSQIIEACRDIDRFLPDRFIRRGSWLALEIAVDRSFGPKRNLQYSTIEHALNLLDSNLDDSAQLDFINLINRLPREDIDQIVMPKLFERLNRTHLPDDLFILDTFYSISQDYSAVLEHLITALGTGDISAKLFLDTLFKYKLPISNIKLSVARVCKLLSSEDIFYILLKNYIKNTEYITSILLQHKQILGIMPFNIFSFLLKYKVGTVHPYCGKSINITKPAEEILQIRMAWEISLFNRYLSEIISEGRPKSNTCIEDLEGIIDDLLKLIEDNSTIIELKASAFALLCKVHFFFYNQPNFDKIIANYVSKLGLDQLDVSESILFYDGVPALEWLRLTDSRPQIVDSDFITAHLHEAYNIATTSDIEYLSMIFSIDPLGPDYRKDILDGIQLKPFPREDIINLIRLMMPYISLRLENEKTNLDSIFVSLVINTINSILEDKDSKAQWQAWETINNLCLFRWSHKTLDLERSIKKMCKLIEKRTDLQIENFSICLIIARISELGFSKELINKLLYIIAKNHKPQSESLISKPHLDYNINQGVVQHLLNMTILAEDDFFIGLLKWFSLLGNSVKINYNLKFNNKRAELALDCNDIIVQEGALLLLSKSESISSIVIERIVNNLSQDRKDIDHAWSDLINRYTIDLHDKMEKYRFLGDIMSKKDNTTFIKQIAFKEYNRLVYEAITDFDEKLLGLPLNRL